MEELIKKLEEQERKIDAIYVSVEKTRTYFKWTFYITLAAVVLPLLAMAVALPSLVSTMSSLYNIQ